VVILHRDLREHVLRDAVRLEVAVGRHRKEARRRRPVADHGMRAERAEAAPPRVTQLLEAEREHAVVHAGGDRHAGVPERVHAGRAEVLDARDGDVEAFQVVRERGAREAALERADPGRLDPARLDAGVGVRLERRLDHEILGRPVVVLAELAAPDADDGDTVTDARFAHVGLAFQK
jgi:hypothetical protein